MELPTPEIKDGIITILTGLAVFCWKKLNGSLSREEFKEWCLQHEKRIETQRVEFRDNLITIFGKIEKHAENDATAHQTITASLARLEERSHAKRATDA